MLGFDGRESERRESAPYKCGVSPGPNRRTRSGDSHTYEILLCVSVWARASFVLRGLSRGWRLQFCVVSFRVECFTE